MYLPRYYNYDLKQLNEKKIACFTDFGNDKLFIEAFEYEIKETLKNGTLEQKNILQFYLKSIGEK